MMLYGEESASANLHRPKSDFSGHKQLLRNTPPPPNFSVLACVQQFQPELPVEYVDTWHTSFFPSLEIPSQFRPRRHGKDLNMN